MGSKYTTQASAGYNSSPPSDNGSQTASNLITWAGIKSKLADVLKTFSESINTALVAAFDYSVRQITTSDSTVAGDHMRTVEIASTVTTAVTVALGDASTMTNVYRVFVKNSSAVNQTISRAIGGDTIDGIARNLIIPPGACWLFQTNAAANGYLIVSEYRESEPDLCDGRLTLTTGVAVTTADVTAATTVYFTPFNGNRVSLYDGIRWRRYLFTEVSVAVPATTSTMYDLFLYDNAGTLTLDATAWTNDTARATALTTQDGVLVKTGATGRRYVGSFRTTGSSGQTEDSLIKRYLWNYYNRIRRAMQVVDTTNSWTYSTGAYQQANASAANQLDYVQGVSEDSLRAQVIGRAINSTATGRDCAVGIGVDSTTANSSLNHSQSATNAVAANILGQYVGYPGIGRHRLVWLEYGAGGGDTITWSGDLGGSVIQTGISGEVLG